MAITLDPSDRRRSYRALTSSTLSEINIIPLVDVVLVLLIIFMLTAHAMESGMQIEVPRVKNVETGPENLPVVNISRTGSVALGESTLNLNLIPEEIRKRFKDPKAVYVRADAHVTYDALAQVVSSLTAANLKVSLVMQPIDAK